MICLRKFFFVVLCVQSKIGHAVIFILRSPLQFDKCLDSVSDLKELEQFEQTDFLFLPITVFFLHLVKIN